jgi:hypothetical protein
MVFDMKGFGREHEGKRLRIEFTDGEICEGELEAVCTCGEHYSCCGIIFFLWATNKPDKYVAAFERAAHPVCWSEIEFVRRFQVLEVESA